jgi:hypothetical protein
LAAEGDSRLWIERHTSFAMMWLKIYGKMLLPVPKVSASRTEAATFQKRQYQNKTPAFYDRLLLSQLQLHLNIPAPGRRA